MRKEFTELYIDRLEYETDNAILVIYGNEQVWIPKSQLEYWDNETISVTEWFAKNNGLL